MANNLQNLQRNLVEATKHKCIQVYRDDIPSTATLEELKSIHRELVMELNAKIESINASADIEPCSGVHRLSQKQDEIIGMFGEKRLAKHSWHYSLGYKMYYKSPYINVTTKERAFSRWHLISESDMENVEEFMKKMIADFRLYCFSRNFTLHEDTVEAKVVTKLIQKIQKQAVEVSAMVTEKAVTFANFESEVWEAYDERGDYYATMHISTLIREAVVKKKLAPYGVLYNKCNEKLKIIGGMYDMLQSNFKSIDKLRDKNADNIITMNSNANRLMQLKAMITDLTDERNETKKREEKKQITIRLRELRDEVKELDHDNLMLDADIKTTQGLIDDAEEEKKQHYSNIHNAVRYLFMKADDETMECLSRILYVKDTAQLIKHTEKKQWAEVWKMIKPSIRMVMPHKIFLLHYESEAKREAEYAAYKAAYQRCCELKPRTDRNKVTLKYIMTVKRLNDNDNE